MDGDRKWPEKDDDLHEQRCAFLEFFLISEDPDITHKEEEECNTCSIARRRGGVAHSLSSILQWSTRRTPHLLSRD